MTTIASDEAQIRVLLERYENALNTSDAVQAAAVYAPDGEFYPYNLPTASGSAIEGSYEAIFSALELEVTFEVHEVVVAGNFAFATTGSRGQVTALDAGITVAEENREVFVFVRVNGEWKISRYMFNKTGLPVQPAA